MTIRSELQNSIWGLDPGKPEVAWIKNAMFDQIAVAQLHGRFWQSLTLRLDSGNADEAIPKPDRSQVINLT
jgi:hypothetical protein